MCRKEERALLRVDGPAVSAYLRTHETHALKEAVGNLATHTTRVSAYLRTYETHALKEAVGNLATHATRDSAYLRTYETHALKQAVGDLWLCSLHHSSATSFRLCLSYH